MVLGGIYIFFFSQHSCSLLIWTGVGVGEVQRLERLLDRAGSAVSLVGPVTRTDNNNYRPNPLRTILKKYSYGKRVFAVFRRFTGRAIRIFRMALGTFKKHMEKSVSHAIPVASAETRPSSSVITEHHHERGTQTITALVIYLFCSSSLILLCLTSNVLNRTNYN